MRSVPPASTISGDMDPPSREVSRVAYEDAAFKTERDDKAKVLLDIVTGSTWALAVAIESSS